MRRSDAPTLAETEGEGRWVLVPGEQVIGRDEDVAIFVDDPDVSRRHARVVVSDDAVHVEDLGSKNGVWISGKPAEGLTALRHGDRLELGSVVLRFADPARRVSGILAAAGEATVTRRREAPPPPKPLPSPWLPMAAALLFAALVVALLIQG